MKRLISLALALNLYGAFPSWYYKVKGTKQQKKAFVEIMLPLIQAENKKIEHLRKTVIDIFNDPYYLINPKKVAFLAKVAKIYKIKNITDKEEFLKKINTIPPSLALAQAAIESGWGKSRFVREANNIFGHWTYSNKGLAPKSKYEHIKIDYSIRIFPSLEASLSAYMKNLNRNPAYKEFRELRDKFTKEHKKFTGIDAADTMINYSQKKEEYVKLLKHMIKANNWQKYDN
ncbi:mannosyl-glycoprotein endo-beta-N-acetylglucosamidase domain protein [Nautilia profundicola AmH]|uniref:Mannosyl-glycoprotein endo-beta-N-acetylglucosamidase domain protein n=1 Tax=Nautilia profundicola (strain ATCC BAA-1463 / DSM 18972 / AmH) TaxID=598659 RepID=B9L796_NAUPA|nr:glucosaminidase domain-containing protein [Nautilia profundicola]ACM93783.1 mannosyl-glycoprotein endo-beta-N-acetylglucosamidase domain protein [Nautilia profundicola AmH]